MVEILRLQLRLPVSIFHDDVIKWKHFPRSPASGEFPTQRLVTRSVDVFFDLCINKRLRKQSWGWWFETLSHPLWRHCNENVSMMRLWYNETISALLTICAGNLSATSGYFLLWRGSSKGLDIFVVRLKKPLTKQSIAGNLRRHDAHVTSLLYPRIIHTVLCVMLWFGTDHMDDLVQDCNISIASTMETLQFCTKPSICTYIP